MSSPKNIFLQRKKTNGNSSAGSVPAASPGTAPKAGKGILARLGALGDVDGEGLIMEYLPAIGLVLVLVIALLGGYFAYDAYREKREERAMAYIYQFKAGPWKNYQDKKLALDEVMKEWSKLEGEVGGEKSFAIFGVGVAEALVKDKKGDEAIKILAPLENKFRGDAHLNYFVAMSLAVYYEDAGQKTKAIEVLENVLKTEAKFLESKIYFDLGRLYQQEGNKEKSKLNFQYVVDNFPDDKLAHLSRLHLAQLM